MSKKPQLSVVIPCYNEGINVRLILKRFREVKGDVNLELILVDNGSTDDTADILAEELAKAENSFARTVLVRQNIGYGNGILFGLQHAKGNILSYTHADMQCDPNDVMRAYKIISQKIHKDKFLIKGRRKTRKVIPQLLTGSFQLIASTLFWERYFEVNAQPKVFHHSFLSYLKQAPLDFNLDFFIVYKAKRLKLKTINIPVEFPERQYGESKWAFSHLSKLKTINNYIKYMINLRFRGEKRAKQ
tara:strand:- start:1717 stop:2451 length:735 start_codon:yes stop_codon:yes gene_type:complete